MCTSIATLVGLLRSEVCELQIDLPLGEYYAKSAESVCGVLLQAQTFHDGLWSCLVKSFTHFCNDLWGKMVLRRDALKCSTSLVGCECMISLDMKYDINIIIEFVCF
jgi:hypothetical protein